MQLLCMIEGNESILLAMNDECGTDDVLHKLEVVEMLSHNITQDRTNLGPHDIPYRGVRGHQHQSARSVSRGQIGGWPTPH